MKTCLIILVCAGVAALGLPAAAQTAGGSQSVSCDRVCLSGVLDDYIAALKAHDPSRLPLAQGVRFTENNVPLALGDGLWNTVDAMGAYRLPFLEPETGQAGLFGVVEENGKPAHLSLRIKVEDRRISEIETIVLRPQANNGFGRPQEMKPRAAFYEDIPPDQQLTREQLVSIANAYFETLQQNHGVVLPINQIPHKFQPAFCQSPAVFPELRRQFRSARQEHRAHGD